MRGLLIFFTLHLDEARNGAVKSKGFFILPQLDFGIQLFNFDFCSGDQVDFVFIKLVDEQNESPAGVELIRKKQRNSFQNDGVETLAQGDVVRSSHCSSAQLIEAEHRHAVPRAPAVELAALHDFNCCLLSFSPCELCKHCGDRKAF